MVNTPKPSLAEWLQQEPFTLCLSSGFFGFYAHVGFVNAIRDAGIAPAAYSGASAGALVASCFASGLDQQQVKDRMMQLNRKQFWDPGMGLGLLRGKKMHEELKMLLPVQKFKQCKHPLSVSTYSPLERRTVVFREGELVDVIRASCAVPLMFQPVWIKRRPYLDGAILDRSGLQGVKPGARVLYHHLTSNSWWRRPGSLATQIPSRENMIAVSIKDLPYVSPFQLSVGESAYRKAYQATKLALSRPVHASTLEL